MIRTAFSTVACPSWTLSRVLENASRWGYDGVELRSFVGTSLPETSGGTGFASEPMLTSGEKIRDLVAHEGVLVSSIATGARFDAPVFPPIIGHVLPAQHAHAEAGKRAVEVASECGAGAIRVYAFDMPKGSSKGGTIRRIADRLQRVCDHARHKDVLVCLENGGAFRKAEQIAEIIDLVGGPLIRASYDVHTGASEGDTASEVIGMFGRRLHTLRLRDTKHGDACLIGDGDAPVGEFVSTAMNAGLEPWATVSWDVKWLEGLAPAEDVLPEAVKRIYGWIGAAHRNADGAAA